MAPSPKSSPQTGKQGPFLFNPQQQANTKNLLQKFAKNEKEGRSHRLKDRDLFICEHTIISGHAQCACGEVLKVFWENKENDMISCSLKNLAEHRKTEIGKML